MVKNGTQKNPPKKTPKKRAYKHADLLERRVKVQKLYAVMRWTEAEIANALNVSLTTIKRDVKEIKKSLREKWKDDKHYEELMDSINEQFADLTKGMVEESAKIRGKDGVMSRSLTVQRLKDLVDHFQNIGKVERVADKVEHSGSLGSIFEQGLALLEEEAKARKPARKNKGVGTVKVRDLNPKQKKKKD